MKFELSSRWCVLVIQQIELGSGESVPDTMNVFGPYEKAEAAQFSNEFNEENNGSPYHAIVRPMSKVLTPDR